jgi:hypothetical protein
MWKMKTILGSRKAQSLARVSILLIAAALIAGMAGCDSDGYTPSQDLEIWDWYDLDDVRDNLDGNHTLMNDLDSTTAGYEELASPTANGGKGWDPIGTFVTNVGSRYFEGTFDGQGYEIRDLFINRPDDSCVGLFHGVGQQGVVKNIGAVNVTVTGKNSVGGLVGFNSGTVINSYSSGNVTGEERVGILAGNSNDTVSNSYSTGSVSGQEYVGSLVGFNGGTVSNSHSTGNVTGYSRVGGLVGCNYYATVSNSHSSAKVIGHDYVGGLVGCNGMPDSAVGEGCTVSDSYSTGNVTGNNWVGGLVGYNYESYVSNSYSSAKVTGDEYVGGLVGKNANWGWIIVGVSDYGVSRSYASGSVTGYGYVGGLVGQNAYAAVNSSYSTTSVTGTSYVGGLVGINSGTVSNSFWDIETSGQSTSAGGTGQNTTEMQNIITFSGAAWNIIAVALNQTNPAYIWNIVNNMTYPFLSWQP